MLEAEQLVPVKWHLTGLKIILNIEDNNNLHQQVAELQRINWLDITIDVALDPSHRQLIRALWHRYLDMLEDCFIEFKIPNNSYLELILDRYQNHIHHGSSDDAKVIDFALELIFIGASTQPFALDVFIYLANIYIAYRLSQLISWYGIENAIKQAIFRRSNHYLELLLENRYNTEIREQMLLDCSVDYFDEQYRQSCYQQLYQQYSVLKF